MKRQLTFQNVSRNDGVTRQKPAMSRVIDG
jgi:hypothetical protein